MFIKFLSTVWGDSECFQVFLNAQIGEDVTSFGHDGDAHARDPVK
jgi:hypothetical protein